MAVQFFQQPQFDKRLTTFAFPLSGAGASYTYQTGYMIWDKPMPGYGNNRAVVNYLYNPSTVSADFNCADSSAQDSFNFPNPGDTAMAAIPLSQTATWSLMFDRTFEVWGGYDANGLPRSIGTTANDGTTSMDPSAIGVQADVLTFMQFTGMLADWSGKSVSGSAQGIIAGKSGMMALWPSWAIFANNSVLNGLTYYGYVSEWSVQYTHWTQFNVPIRCVISVTFTMLPMPKTQPPSRPTVTTLPGGLPGNLPGSTGVGAVSGGNIPVVFGTQNSGIGGR